MPVFNLELKFDDKGALQAVRKIEGVAGAANDATDAVNKLGKSASSSSQALSRMGSAGGSAIDALSNKMKGLVRDVIALAAAYGSVKSAMAFMNRGLEFNSSMEQSKIGIASLITSMVKLQDEQGKLLEGQEKYNAAQEIAAELMQRIQVLGLETTATSQDLVEGVQSIMGPALQAGMALKEIPDFAVQGAQAMQTLGIPLNQMRTELEALLSGNVNKTQDILAPKLFADINGDLREYIQGLKESGKLIPEIMKRLEPFKLAGQDVAQTWGALKSNLSEAIDVLAGQSATNFTNSLKQSVNLLNELIIGGNKKGELGIGKDFKNIANVLTEIESKIGGALLKATEKVVEFAKEFNDYLGSNEAVQHLDYLTTAVKALGSALMGFAAARGVAFGFEKWKAITSAVASYKNNLVNVAREELKTVQAAKARFIEYMKTEKAQQAAANSSRVRQGQIARETQLINQEIAAQQRLNSVMTMGAGKSALGAGLKGLSSMMGGPLNIAVTGLVTAMSFLAMGEDKAADATDRHTAAQDTYQKVIQGSIDQTGKLTRVLDAAELAQARAAQRQLSRDWVSGIRSIEKEIDDAEKNITDSIETINAAYGEMLAEGSIDVLPDNENVNRLKDAIGNVKELFKEVRVGNKDLKDIAPELDKIQQSVKNIDTGNIVTNLIDRILSAKDLEETGKKLKESNEVIKQNEEAQKNNAKAVSDSSNAYKDAIDALNAYNEANSTNITNAKEAQEYLDKLLKTTPEFTKATEENTRAKADNAIKTMELAYADLEAAAIAAQAIAMLDGATDAEIKGADDLANKAIEMRKMIDSFKKGLSEYKEGKTGKTGRSRSGGSGMSAENAAEKWKELTQQLAQLEGKSTSSRASLDKTLKSIEDTGKAAKKSASEISDMQKAFIAASDKKALQELNKELLQLEGNTKELQQIERQEKTDQLKAKIADIRGLSEDERNILLNRVEEGVQREQNVKDLQTSVDFFKELESLGGEYGQSLELQNQLIENQAALYRDALKPEFQGYVDEWQKLKQLSNDKTFMSGITRGLRKFGADYGDVANQVEQFTTSMGSHISNTLADAFMKGKFSAQDFFNSLISMAAQAASNAFIGKIFSGIGSAFGGMFGGTPTSGYSGSSANYSDVGPMIPNGVYHKGGMAGYSNDFRLTPLSAFYGAPKFHSGGGFFRWGEYPAILKAGERVLNPAETKAYNAGQSSMGGWNASPIVNVKVVNESGNPVEAQSQANPNGMGGFDLDIIISQVEQGIVSRAKQGKSQLMQYQQTAYGLDRANVLARGRGRA